MTDCATVAMERDNAVAEQPSSASESGPLSRDASEELVATIEQIRHACADRQIVSHGWKISFTLRPASKQMSGRRQGDFIMVDPSDGEKLYSVLR